LRFPLFIALRYLFSRKSTQVIHLISGISVLGVMVGTAALLVLLSAFNGLENWVVRLYDAFDPDLKARAVEGRYFEPDSVAWQQLRKLDDLQEVIPVMEANALALYGDASFICTMKGVGDGFLRMSGVDSMMTDGEYDLGTDSMPGALVGAGVAYALSMNLRNAFTAIELYVPKPGAGITLNPAEAFYSGYIRPTGVFRIQPEVDSRYILVPLRFASKVSGRDKQLSHYEMQLKPGADSKKVQAQVQHILGTRFRVQNRFEQHALLYKIINSEKWAVYLILSFIVLIAIFNIIGSMTMLIVDKAPDIRTLESLGCSERVLRQIFFFEGMLISGLGMLLGLILGFVLIALQDHLGMIRISDLEAYPVLFQWRDLVLVLGTVTGIGALAAWYPAARLLRRYRNIA
jgi:lipoprotein-releasing system permease protein